MRRFPRRILILLGDTGTGSIDLDSQTMTIAGTANEVETSASGQTITIGLPATVAVTAVDVTNLEVTNLKGKRRYCCRHYCR